MSQGQRIARFFCFYYRAITSAALLPAAGVPTLSSRHINSGERASPGTTSAATCTTTWRLDRCCCCCACSCSPSQMRPTNLGHTERPRAGR
ncbi:hypothetical protein AAFF_G00303410 [Aldrovandia affinis]|uniref:Uncharacterized protein n=1 Tax=Aldrovandia affinis TaxID=143900 RepID=A0AAD7R8G4_9TELE|nr:hypothetical protein AAFF_G00303410 [Aldrovandia affinis]